LNALPDLTGGKMITVQIDKGDGNGPQPLGQTDMGRPVWSYDSGSNAIIFSTFYVPEPGDTLTVTYYVACN
jgi:hypothetical protein